MSMAGDTTFDGTKLPFQTFRLVKNETAIAGGDDSEGKPVGPPGGRTAGHRSTRLTAIRAGY